MTEALRLRRLRLQLSLPVVVERSPSKPVLVRHLREDPSHRDVAPTVEDRTGSPFLEPLSPAVLSELSCLKKRPVPPAPSGTVRPEGAGGTGLFFKHESSLRTAGDNGSRKGDPVRSSTVGATSRWEGSSRRCRTRTGFDGDLSTTTGRDNCNRNLRKRRASVIGPDSRNKAPASTLGSDHTTRARTVATCSILHLRTCAADPIASARSRVFIVR